MHLFGYVEQSLGVGPEEQTTRIGIIPFPAALAFTCATLASASILGITLGVQHRQRADQSKFNAPQNPSAYPYQVLRLGCILLLGCISIREVVAGYGPLQIVQIIFYSYISLVGFMCLRWRPAIGTMIEIHIRWLLFGALALFTFHDLVPLGLVHGRPVDPPDNWMTWARIALLTISALLIPLITPRTFVPVDPERPLPPTPEQTASILSLIFYSFETHLLDKAAKVPHLPYDELPPLADDDHMDYLVRKSWMHLDPLRVAHPERHIFWGLLKTYRNEYAMLWLVVTSKVLLGLLGPFSLNHLLQYLETAGQGAVVRPWVWIFALFTSSLGAQLVQHFYNFRISRLVVQLEGRLTQLIFQHALRIRIQEEVSDDAESVSTTAAAPESPRSEPTVIESTHETEASVPETEATLGADTEPPAADSSKALEDKDTGKHLVGKITNLMSTDAANIVSARDTPVLLVQMPIQLGLSVWLLYSILGWSAIIGVLAAVVTLPVPGRLAQRMNQLQVEQMKRSDARIQALTEVLGVVRMVKFFGWENKMAAWIGEKREKEIRWQLKRQVVHVLNINVNHFIPVATMLATFAIFTLVMHEPLTASRVFSAIAVFETIQNCLHQIFYEIPLSINAKVSLDRLNDFLHQTEVLERYLEKDNSNSASETSTIVATPRLVGIKDATFAWRKDTPQRSTRSRNFKLRIEGELLFKEGKLNIVVGPTGCGKTSLLLALLGEMRYYPQSPASFVRLPREQGIAYAAQEAWIQNATIKENILFGYPLDEARYKKVLEQCVLLPDLELFEAGDNTEIGERGVTLSGGQKARVALARAIYSPASIVLLDDVLSALDVHTSRKIVETCLLGDVLTDRTVVLVTHNIALLGPVADFIVTLGSDGRVASQDTKLTDALAANPEMKEELANEAEETDKEEVLKSEAMEPQPKLQDASAGKLVVAEEVVHGRIGWAAFKFYFGSFGGRVFWIAFFGTLIMARIASILETWFLGYWAAQYSTHAPGEVNVPLYLTGYTILSVLNMGGWSLADIIFIFGTRKGARATHQRLLAAVMGSSLRWLDSTPIGRIVSRFTIDIRNADGPVAGRFMNLVSDVISLSLNFVAVLVNSPIFTIPGIIVCLYGIRLGNKYLRAQLPIKREMSNAKSPIYSHTGAAIAGLITIRAFGAEEAFLDESKKRIDYYSRPARSYYNMNRWISVRIDLLGSLFYGSLAAYLVYIARVSASTIGFSLSLAMTLTESLLWTVRFFNMFEVDAQSLERIKSYVDIEQEPKPTEAGTPPAYWPASGALHVENLCARYSHDGPNVLHDISFDIKSGEHVGVVGRTGAGKSSLSLALLRMIPTSGQVFLDGRDISGVNLEALRRNVTIIPQQPELMSGTLRQNLDPFEEHDDATLNDCLRSAGLYSLQSESDSDRITLDTVVASGGSNFSLGQRQIIALARAMARRSKLYILDEATASVDYKTDAAIQEAIATEFNDKTLIVVAHRLQTIMGADRILVLDAGKLAEFDTPKALLAKGGIFKTLVDGSGDKELLYQMANATPVR